MIKIEVKKGDITKTEADAVVNAANNRLWMGGGVAGAIKRAGGDQIEAEAISKGPIPIGEAVVTRAGKLPAKYVIHAAAMGTDLQTDEEKIGKATRNALLRAEELGIKSVAFPALGTGVGGFPVDECARVMLTEVDKCNIGFSSLEKVIFVLLSDRDYQTFKKEKEWMERRETITD
jgi:O-acetyl-ADP-ribose deacetylase (regulator of RNase III)